MKNHIEDGPPEIYLRPEKTVSFFFTKYFLFLHIYVFKLKKDMYFYIKDKNLSHINIYS